MWKLDIGIDIFAESFKKAKFSEIKCEQIHSKLIFTHFIIRKLS